MTELCDEVSRISGGPQVMMIEEVLNFLNKHEIRATYEAVGEVMGTNPQSILLGDRRSRASWVVSKRTEDPTGYTAEQEHPRLRSKKDVIRSGAVLSRLLAREREMRERDRLWMEREIEQMRED